MTLQRTARCAHAAEDPTTDYFRVGIAEHEDFTGWYLMFHGGPADPNYRLDNEDYCLETETAAFAFGGLASVVLTDTALHLELTPQAAAQLEFPDPIIEIALDVDAAAVVQLAQALARVFATTSAKTRPPRLDLASARLTNYGARRRRTRKPQPTLVTFEVVRQRGALADSQPISPVGQDLTTSMPAQWLAQQLAINEAELVGTRYTCLATPDNWGTTYSDYRLVKH